MPAKFIVIEGPDYSGKTTQAKLLLWYLKKKKRINTKYIREPGGTKIGEKIRTLLLDSKNSMSILTELFLYMASRANLVENKIIPMLKKDVTVVCDRYFYSSVAYQGGAGGIGINNVYNISLTAIKNVLPDLVILLDISPREAFKRSRTSKDRIEKRPLSFHKKVHKAFIEIANKEPNRIKIINALLPVEEVQRRIRCLVDSIL